MILNPFKIYFMPKYIIPNQIPRKYQMETILSKTKPEYGSSRSFLSHMEELYISGSLSHQIYLSSTIFFLVHILIIAFYLGTLMAAITEIIQKSDGLDFSSAEILSRGQMKIFAYNNIGKFSQNSQLSRFM